MRNYQPSAPPVSHPTFDLIKARASDGTLVTIKVLKQRTLRGDTIGQAQVRILRKLRHRHIQQLIQVTSYKGNLALILERSESLVELMDNQRPWVHETKSKKVLYHILKGLQHVHSLNFVHRGLRPESILINRGVAKLADFTYSVEKDKIPMEQQGALPYRAPEMLMGLRYDYAVDIWALGCIFFQMTAGKVLFSSDSVQQQIDLIARTIGQFRQNQAFFYNLKQGPKSKQSGEVINVQKQLEGKISPIGIHLFHQMMDTQPQSRITARRALQHPYFKELREAQGVQTPKPQHLPLIQRARVHSESKLRVRESITPEVPLSLSQLVKQKVMGKHSLRRVLEEARLLSHKH